MRELCGVIPLGNRLTVERLKHYAVLFDKFIIVDNETSDQDPALFFPLDPVLIADMDFLSSRDVLMSRTVNISIKVTKPLETRTMALHWKADEDDDWILRLVAAGLHTAEVDVVPICRESLPLELPNDSKDHSVADLLRIGLEAFPIPDQTCSWEDILDFKSSLRDKQWGFRRFLESLATRSMKEAEVRDEIEWMLNEYTNAMRIHNLKASNSFVDVFVISPLEIIENIVKFKWSKIAKGTLSVQKRKVELMEAEMKAPSRECAYVFDARKRFGAKS
jgi:hypothetical protein